jgi:hypothetical protein
VFLPYMEMTVLGQSKLSYQIVLTSDGFRAIEKHKMTAIMPHNILLGKLNRH